jgi:hypothetical protein
MYAYQMFGQVNWDTETRIKIFQESKENFKPWEGLVTRTILWDKEADIATVIYMCDTLEAVEKAKEHVHREREKYKEVLEYFTEIQPKVMEHNYYK